MRELTQRQVKIRPISQPFRKSRSVPMTGCWHNLLATRDGRAKCEKCGEHLGWYCLDSPDCLCHYYTDAAEGRETRVVRDLSGSYWEMWRDYNWQNEDGQSCIFCGKPKTRK
jgi:hypothetical protein